jgi:hypothetical protein
MQCRTNDKNSLWGELNIRKPELNVKRKKTQDMGWHQHPEEIEHILPEPTPHPTTGFV